MIVFIVWDGAILCILGCWAEFLVSPNAPNTPQLQQPEGLWGKTVLGKMKEGLGLGLDENCPRLWKED